MATVFKFPVYQIDFTAAAAGKRVAATKRRVRWRFGFPNKEALAQGLSGTDCRGEEHEIVVVWSVTSGKRQIMFDGKEIHYSATRTGVIDHSWSSKGNHVMKVVCHAAPPMTADPGFRQYDLFIDGQSFFTMPKVYEIGIRGNTDRAAPYGGMSSPAGRSGGPLPPGITPPRNQDEEAEDLQRAINASLEETRQHLDRKGPAPAQAHAPSPDFFGGGGDNDLFSSPPPPAPPAPQNQGGLPHSDASIISYSSAPTRYGGPAATPYPGAPPPQQQLQHPGYPGAPPPQQQGYGAPQQQQGYGAPPPQPGYGAPPQPQAYGAPMSQQGYQGYGAPAPGPLALPSNQPTGYPGAPPPPQSSPATAEGNFFSSSYGEEDPFAPKPPSRSDIASEILKGYSTASPTSSYGAPPPTPNGAAAGQPYNAPQQQQQQQLSMNGLAAGQDDDANLSDLEKAMRKLVNVERIDEPAEEKIKLTMKMKEEEDAKKKKNKSQPLPPAAYRVVGSHATLSQIGGVKAKKETKEGIMNTPPWDPAAQHAGMLVVHGQPNQGPPPLAPRGFGVVHGQQPYAGYGQAPPPQQQYGYPPQYR